MQDLISDWNTSIYHKHTCPRYILRIWNTRIKTWPSFTIYSLNWLQPWIHVTQETGNGQLHLHKPLLPQIRSQTSNLARGIRKSASVEVCNISYILTVQLYWTRRLQTWLYSTSILYRKYLRSLYSSIYCTSDGARIYYLLKCIFGSKPLLIFTNPSDMTTWPWDHEELSLPRRLLRLRKPWVLDMMSHYLAMASKLLPFALLMTIYNLECTPRI